MYLSHGVHPKKITAPALILTLLFTALAGSLLVNMTAANFGMLYYPWSPPPIPIVEVTGSVGASSPITFPVETAGQQIGSESLSFPTTLLIAAVLVAAVVCAGLLLYFIKFKKRRSQT